MRIQIEKEKESSKIILDMKQIEEDLRNRIFAVNHSLESSINEKESMATEKANIEVKLNTLQAETENKILDLENQLKLKIEEISILETDVKLHSSIENKLKQTVEEKEQEVLANEEEHENLQKTIEDCHEKFLNLENNECKLNKIVEVKDRKIMELEVQIDTVSQSSQQKIRQIENSMQEKMRDILNDKEIEATELREAIAKLQGELQSQSRRESLIPETVSAFLETESSVNMNQSLEFNSDGYSELEKELEKAKKLLQHRNNDIEKKERLINDMQESKRRMKSQMAAMATENDNIANSVQKLRQLYQQLQTSKDHKIGELEKKLEEYKKNYNVTTNNNANLKHDKTKAQKRVKELEMNDEDCQKTLQLHVQQSKIALEKLAKKEKEYAVLCNIITQRDEDLTKKMNQARAAVEQVAKAQNAMDDAYLDRDGLASELEMVQEQNTRAQEEIEELQEKNNELREDCVRLSGNQNLNARIKYMQKLKGEIDDKQDHIYVLQKKLKKYEKRYGDIKEAKNDGFTHLESELDLMQSNKENLSQCLNNILTTITNVIPVINRDDLKLNLTGDIIEDANHSDCILKSAFKEISNVQFKMKEMCKTKHQLERLLKAKVEQIEFLEIEAQSREKWRTGLEIKVKDVQTEI